MVTTESQLEIVAYRLRVQYNVLMMKKQTHKPNRDTWYKLDLSATVYPTLQRRTFSNVYRLSITLTEEIRPDVLQQALDLTMPRFPAYKVAMRTGVFWRYLEPNDRPGPFVRPDIANPCMPMHFRSNNRYLLRVYYYHKRISVEMFHSLADGFGGLCFLKTLTAVYLRLLGHEIPSTHGVLDVALPPDPEELEDAYLRYASSKVKPSRTNGSAYSVRGTYEPFYTLNIICGVMPADQVYRVAKSYGVSVTEYLNGVLLYALLQKQRDDKPFREKPVKIAMPVNLRQFFPSKTLRNFINMVYPSIDPRMGEFSFEEIVTQVHYFMRYSINEKFMNADMTTNTATLQNPLIRLVPLFLKELVVRQFYRTVQDGQSSAGLTNLGIIPVPPEMEPYVERLEGILGQPFSRRTNCAIMSYGGNLTINFSSSIKEADVERYFFRKLVQDGIHVKIESNRKEEC